MQKIRFPDLNPVILIIFLVCFYAVNNYFWIKMSDPLPIDSDEGYHAIELFEKYYVTNTVNDLKEAIKHNPYSPIYHYTAVVFMKLIGKDLSAARMANIIWVIIMFVGVYLLGAYIFDRETGILATILISFYPIIFTSSRIFRESFGLIGITAICILMLLKSDSFRSLKYSLLLALIAGIGVMTKKTFFICTGMPILYIFIKGLIQKKFKKKILLNFALFIIIVGVTASIRYLDINELLFHATSIFNEPTRLPWYNFESLNIFTLGIIYYQLTLPFFLLFIFGLYVFLNKTQGNKKVVLMLWIIVPIVFWTLIPHRKMLRVILPYLPPFAVITAYGMSSIKKIKIKRILIILMVLIGIIQYFGISYGVGLKLHKLRFKIYGKEIPYYSYYAASFNNTPYGPPMKSWIHAEVKSIIDGDLDREDDTVLLIFPSIAIDERSWRVMGLSEKSRFKVISVENRSRTIFYDLLDAVKYADYLLCDLAVYNVGYIKYLNYYRFMLGKRMKSKNNNETQEDYEDFIKEDFAAYRNMIIDELDTFREIRILKKEDSRGYVLLKRYRK